jgi:hypothetical protein
MPRTLLIAAFVFAVFVSPLHAAETPAPAAAPAAAMPAVAGNDDLGPSEARTAKMRARYNKIPPEQKEEIRKKAERRMQERFERLSPQQQQQVVGLQEQVAKLDKEERSIFLARIHQKAYLERQQKKAMKEQQGKATTPVPTATPASAPAAITPTATPAAAPSEPAKPVSP